jgi:hypothetical protein
MINGGTDGHDVDLLENTASVQAPEKPPHEQQGVAPDAVGNFNALA